MGKEISGKSDTLLQMVSPSTIDSFFELSPDAIIFTDEEGTVLSWNKKATDIFGYPGKDIIGKSVLMVLPGDYRRKNLIRFNRLIKSGKASVKWDTAEIEGIKKDGEKVLIEISSNIFKEGDRYLNVYMIRDISRAAELQKKLYRQAVTDHLTGLYNRRYCEEVLKSEFKRASRYKRPFSVVVIDIDGFKQANDLYGHYFGDEVLLETRDVFEETSRNLDILCRYGGDEFVMILPETAKEGAIDVAERVRSRFVEKCKKRDERVRLSLSIGLATFPEDGKDEKCLLEMADRRMYNSKGKGGNVVTAYTVDGSAGTRTESLLNSLTLLAITLEESRAKALMNETRHSQRARVLTMDIGRELGISSERLTLLEHASILHDIGMTFIPKEILNKAGKLTELEAKEIRKHPLIGEEIIEATLSIDGELENLPGIVASHHEWINGKGYPRGLKGEDIPLETRILTVVDAYESMTSYRPYRDIVEPDRVVKELRRYAGVRYDPVIVDLLLDLEVLRR